MTALLLLITSDYIRDRVVLTEAQEACSNLKQYLNFSPPKFLNLHLYFSIWFNFMVNFLLNNTFKYLQEDNRSSKLTKVASIIPHGSSIATLC